MTQRKLVRSIVCSCLFLITLMSGYPLAATRITLGTPVKEGLAYLLPLTAAEEQGYWKELGVELNWVPTAGGPALFAAVAAGSIKVGMNYISANILMASRGIRAPMVARLGQAERWAVWVRPDSPFTDPAKLKDAKIGVTRLGSLTHAYTRAAFRAINIEAKIVAAGGTLANLAAVQSGALDASVIAEGSVAKAVYEGKIRELLNLSAYIPADLVMTFVTPELIEKEPDMIRKTISGLLQAVRWVVENPTWTKEKLEKRMGWPAPLAERFARTRIPESWRPTGEGRIDAREIQAVREFMISNGLISAEKTPPLEALYTDKFVPVR